MPIDIKKDIKPLIKPDWTRMKGTKAFFQQASGSLAERYSITVITEATTTEGSDSVLTAIKNNALPIGYAKILEFYEKIDSENSRVSSAFAEDWYVAERPKSKIKILVSIPADLISSPPPTGLADSLPPLTLPTPWSEMYFNTFDFQTKVKGVSDLLKKYNSEIQRFRGKVQGFNLEDEIDNFSNSVAVIAGLMQANGYAYGTERSDLLVFGIDEGYNFLYGQINDGTGFETLYKEFKKFQESSVGANDRTVNFLFQLDKLYNIYVKNENIPMQTFFDEYVRCPPTYDFAEQSPKSPTKDGLGTGASRTAEDNEKSQKTTLELESFVAWSSSDEQAKNAQKVLDGSANFVGDWMMNTLQKTNDAITLGTGFMTRNPGNYVSDEIFKNLLNKIPLQSLIQAALECLGFPGFEFLGMAKAFLNQANSFLDNVSALLNKQIPTIQIPDNFPIADYMKDLGMKILMGILEAVMGVLIQMLVEIIQQLLEACNECALANEAEGRSRFDGMNFGALNVGDTIFETLVVGTVGELGSTLMRETGANQISEEVLAETKEWAKNPLLLTDNKVNEGFAEAFGFGCDGDAVTGAAVRVPKAQTEVSEYLQVASGVLTPGEIGNLLLGCGSGDEAMEAATNLFDNFPDLKALLCPSGVCSHAATRRFWEDAGKIVGVDPILQKVKEVTDAMPESVKCLCDADDIALRRQLLENKGLSDDQIVDQIGKSKDRRKQRLEDLGDMLKKGNPLEGMVPPIYCTTVYRDNQTNEIIPNEKVMPDPTVPSFRNQFISRETGEVVQQEIQQGLMEKDHPSFVFMMNKVLNAIYDSIAMAFNQDINGLVSTLTRDTYGIRQIPRLSTTVYDDGTSEITLNPEWVRMVKDSSLNYSFGALPADASIPGTNIIRDVSESTLGFGGGDEEVMNGIGGESGDTERGDPLLDYPDPPDISIRNRMASGQMQTGQKQPTALQEAAWEEAMIAQGQASAGRTNGGRKRPAELRADGTDVGERLAKYSELYGYSPIPIEVKEKKETKFAPGLKEAYEEICSNTALFNISDSGDNKYHLYSFRVDNNIFEAAGIGPAADIILGKTNNSAPSPTPPPGVKNADFTQGMDILAEAFRNLENSTYDINYVIPFDISLDPITNLPSDTYGSTIMLSPAPMPGSAGKPPFIIYQKVEKKPLKGAIERCINRNDCRYEYRPPTVWNTEVYIPQEQYFVSWNEELWQTGAEVYRKGQHESTSRAISPGVGSLSDNKLQFLQNAFYDNGIYDSLWREYYCKFTRMISKSPFLDLGTLSSLNLTPMNKMDQQPNCDPDPSLLDIETIKTRIKEEYGLIQCIESSFPNVDGLGTNKDNPFEMANLGGAVLLTVRTYVLEVMLRSIFVFYYFRFTSPESVDTLLISYIAGLLKKDVTEKGFINEFTIETLNLYNRNAANINREETDDFEVALEYFIRYQIFGVCNRLAKTLGSVGDISLDSYLLEDQSATNPAWIPGYNVPSEISGKRPFRDGNGNMIDVILETGVVSANGRPGTNPIPANLVQSLIGDGPLSSRTVPKYQWTVESNEGPVSYLRNLPIGMLMREYYGESEDNKKAIWSRESPQVITQTALLSTRADEEKESTSWGWITSTEDLSECKGLPQTIPGTPGATGELIGQREWSIFEACNFIYNNALTMTAGAKFQSAINPSQIAGKPGIPTENVAYSYGVSYEEELGMKKLLKLLLPILANYDTAVMHNSGWHQPGGGGDFRVTALNDWFYPGKFLAEQSYYAGGSGRYEHTFKFNDVFDNSVWGGQTGREVPAWVKNEAGQQVPGGEWVPWALDAAPPGHPKNGWYSKNHWYVRQGTQTATSATDIQTLRFIRVGGKTIGPWMGFNFGGKFAFKLIDPRLLWDLNSGQHASIASGHTNYQSYIDWVAAGKPDIGYMAQTYTYGDGFGNDLIEQLSGPGITVGVEDYDPARFGLGGPTAAKMVGVNPFYDKLFLRAKNLVLKGMPYLSLLDFDILSIKKILEWERSGPAAAALVADSGAGRARVDLMYQRAIGQVDEIIEHFKKAGEFRKKIAADFLEQVRDRGIARNDPPADAIPGPNFANGSFIKEFYLRVNELPYQGMPRNSTTDYELFLQTVPGGAFNPIGPQITVEGLNQVGDAAIHAGTMKPYEVDIEVAKWANSNFVDNETSGRTDFLKGVVNIDAFQDFLNPLFHANGDPNLTSLHNAGASGCDPQKLTKALIRDLSAYQDCGEAMANRLGIGVDPNRDKFVLGDFFENVYVGVRISYVMPLQPHPSQNASQQQPPETGVAGATRHASYLPSHYASRFGFTEPCWRWSGKDWPRTYYSKWLPTPCPPLVGDICNDSESPFNQIPIPDGTYDFNIDSALSQKAYYVRNDRNADTQVAHVIPIVCSEVEIDPRTTMDLVVKSYPYSSDGVTQSTQGFFAKKFNENYKSILLPQLWGSDEYKMLFRYLFPMDRMLSLHNIYGSEYLRSYKGMNELFDPTKMRLKDLFFNLYNSGNYEADCAPNNLDLQLGALNGIPWKGLAATLALMIAKCVLLIFKGFVEVFDINIAVSKMIRDAIHLVNALIAQGQIMANQGRQLGAAAEGAIDDMKNIGKSCTTDVPRQPPDDWFDPIKENFIPEPQIMFISLALLPITLLPLLWPGLPITPFGVAYWFLDAKPLDIVPGPNWLNAMPPADWLDKLFNKDDTQIANSGISDNFDCPTNIDVGMPPLDPNGSGGT